MHAEMAECRCVWCGGFYVGRDRSQFCRRTCRQSSWRHPYRRWRTAVSLWWLCPLDPAPEGSLWEAVL